MLATEILGDAIRVVLGVAFLYYGYFDVWASPARRAEFQKWGYGPWVQPTGGVLQLGSVVLMILPETVAFGAVILLAMMIFSIYVHGIKDYQPRQLPPSVILAALALVAFFLYGPVAWGPAGAIFRALFGTF